MSRGCTCHRFVRKWEEKLASGNRSRGGALFLPFPRHRLHASRPYWACSATRKMCAAYAERLESSSAARDLQRVRLALIDSPDRPSSPEKQTPGKTPRSGYARKLNKSEVSAIARVLEDGERLLAKHGNGGNGASAFAKLLKEAERTPTFQQRGKRNPILARRTSTLLSESLPGEMALVCPRPCHLGIVGRGGGLLLRTLTPPQAIGHRCNVPP